MAIAVSIISNSHIASKAMHVASYFMIIVVACLISININIMIASDKILCHSTHKNFTYLFIATARKAFCDPNNVYVSWHVRFINDSCLNCTSSCESLMIPVQP